MELTPGGNAGAWESHRLDYRPHDLMPGGILPPGRHELADELVDQLQNAIDQLKHGTEPDQKANPPV